MAYVHKTAAGGYRAQVEKRGVRRSRGFETEIEALMWAAHEEEKIERKHELRNISLEAGLLSRVPRRLLEAAVAADFDHSTVVKTAIPVPTMCGVYFLISGGEVKYVGQSTNVLARLLKHFQAGRVFDSYNVVCCPPERLDELERTYITAFMPPWNQNLGGPAEGVKIRPRRASIKSSTAVVETT